MLFFFFFKQKTAYEMRISDWSSDVCSSDLAVLVAPTPTTAAGDGRLVLVETENRQHRAAALVEIGLTLAVVEAVAHLVIARRLRLGLARSEEHTSELQSLMRISYAVF